jgi:hypothetical protein
MKAVGLVLIVIGLLAGASTGASGARPAQRGASDAEKFGTAIGGALFSLLCVIGGAALALSGQKKKKGDGSYQRPDPTEPSKASRAAPRFRLYHNQRRVPSGPTV